MRRVQMSKHQIFHGQFYKNSDGKLTASDSCKVKYEQFVKSTSAGQTVELFMEANEGTGTLAQLAKIHACIRAIAAQTGDSYEETKFDIKKRSGLCFTTLYKEEKVLFCKSLGDCSTEELGKVIEVVIEIGNFIGINFN